LAGYLGGIGAANDSLEARRLESAYRGPLLQRLGDDAACVLDLCSKVEDLVD